MVKEKDASLYSMYMCITAIEGKVASGILFLSGVLRKGNSMGISHAGGLLANAWPLGANIHIPSLLCGYGNILSQHLEVVNF